MLGLYHFYVEGKPSVNTIKYLGMIQNVSSIRKALIAVATKFAVQVKSISVTPYSQFHLVVCEQQQMSQTPVPFRLDFVLSRLNCADLRL